MEAFSNLGAFGILEAFSSVEAFGMYLLKASAILALFLGTYHLLLRRETLFTVNRLFLAGGLLAALTLPLVTFTRTIRVTLAQQPAVTLEPVTAPANAGLAGFPWENFLLAAYLAGVAAHLFLILFQLWRIFRLVQTSNTVREEGFLYVPTHRTEAPFSFFRYIFYNPDQHSQRELALILEHEKAHGSQCHTLDILLGRVVSAILWINPMGRWYQRSIEQNLEYLADASAIQKIPSLKDYQYTLLKVSGNTPVTSLVNAFYSSLIKKRILMLHQNQSKTTHILKHLLIVPVLGLFLMAFNTETRYVLDQESPSDYLFEGDDKTVELTISKDTSDEELQKIKDNLASDGIDFSYTTVRNDAGEIIDLKVSMSGKSSSGKSFSGSFHTETDSPIEPVLIRFDDTRNSVSFGSADELHFGHGKKHRVRVHSLGDGDDSDKDAIIEIRKMHDEDGNVFYWNSEGKDDAEHIEIKIVDGEKTIIVDGEEMDEEAFGKLHKSEGGKHKVRVHRVRDTQKDTNVMILRDSDDEADMEIINGDSGSFFLLDSGKGEKPLYLIDGKKASEKQVRELDPSDIEKVEVLKGDNATEKYGRKAKDGVVSITTKD